MGLIIGLFYRIRLNLGLKFLNPTLFHSIPVMQGTCADLSSRNTFRKIFRMAERRNHKGKRPNMGSSFNNAGGSNRVPIPLSHHWDLPWGGQYEVAFRLPQRSPHHPPPSRQKECFWTPPPTPSSAPQSVTPAIGPPVPSPSEPFPSFPSFPSVPSSFPSAPDSPTQVPPSILQGDFHPQRNQNPSYK